MSLIFLFRDSDASTNFIYYFYTENLQVALFIGKYGFDELSFGIQRLSLIYESLLNDIKGMTVGEGIKDLNDLPKVLKREQDMMFRWLVLFNCNDSR